MFPAVFLAKAKNNCSYYHHLLVISVHKKQMKLIQRLHNITYLMCICDSQFCLQVRNDFQKVCQGFCGSHFARHRVLYNLINKCFFLSLQLLTKSVSVANTKTKDKKTSCFMLQLRNVPYIRLLKYLYIPVKAHLDVWVYCVG